MRNPFHFIAEGRYPPHYSFLTSTAITLYSGQSASLSSTSLATWVDQDLGEVERRAEKCRAGLPADPRPNAVCPRRNYCYLFSIFDASVLSVSGVDQQGLRPEYPNPGAVGRSCCCMFHTAVGGQNERIVFGIFF